MTFPSAKTALKTHFSNLWEEKKNKKKKENKGGKKETISNIYGAVNLFTWRIGKIKEVCHASGCILEWKILLFFACYPAHIHECLRKTTLKFSLSIWGLKESFVCIKIDINLYCSLESHSNSIIQNVFKHTE